MLSPTVPRGTRAALVRLAIELIVCDYLRPVAMAPAKKRKSLPDECRPKSPAVPRGTCERSPENNLAVKALVALTGLRGY